MSVDQLIPALLKAQSEISQPKKSATNPHFKSKFADLAACFDAVREPLRANGLTIIQTVDVEGEHDVLCTSLYHISGQSIASRSRLLLTKQDAQGQGSAITYARRYALCAMLGLVAEPDDDGNAASKSAKPAEPSMLDTLALELSVVTSEAEVAAIEAKLPKNLTFGQKAKVAELMTRARTKISSK